MKAYKDLETNQIFICENYELTEEQMVDITYDDEGNIIHKYTKYIEVDIPESAILGDLEA